MSQQTRPTLTPQELRSAVAVFEPLSDPDLRLLIEHGEVRSYGDGEMIFHEGAPARALYFLVRGSVRIHRKLPTGAQVDLVTFEKGAIFGEVALLAGGTERNASASSVGQVIALRVPKEKLYADYQDAKPYSLLLLLEVAKLLACRLEAMNRRLADTISSQSHGGELEIFKKKMFTDWTI